MPQSLLNSRKDKNVLIFISIIFLLFAHIFIFLKLNLIGLLSGKIEMLDIDAYYHLSHAVLNSTNPYQVPTMQTAGPPLVILPFIPLSIWKIDSARVLITLLNLLSATISCYLLAKKVNPKLTILMTLFFSTLLWISFPARFSLSLGQPNLIIMLFITLTLINQTKSISALYLTFILTLKSFFVFSLLAIIKKNTKIFALSLVLILAIVVASLQLIKPEYYRYFISQRAKSTVLASQTIKDVDYYNQSIKTTASRFGFKNYYQEIFIVVVLLSIIFLFNKQSLSSAIIVSTLLSPVVWQHYFVYFFPIYVLLFFKLFDQKKYQFIIFLLISFVLNSVEIKWLQNKPTTLFNSLLASHYLIGSLILLLILDLFDNKKTN